MTTMMLLCDDASLQGVIYASKGVKGFLERFSDAKYEITSSSEGDSGSGQCLSNVFSGPVGRTLAIAGQSFTNS